MAVTLHALLTSQVMITRTLVFVRKDRYLCVSSDLPLALTGLFGDCRALADLGRVEQIWVLALQELTKSCCLCGTGFRFYFRRNGQVTSSLRRSSALSAGADKTELTSLEKSYLNIRHGFYIHRQTGAYTRAIREAGICQVNLQGRGCLAAAEGRASAC